MNPELNLSFPDKDHVTVRFDGEDSGALRFKNPLTAKDRRDIRWYLEVYGSRWGSDRAPFYPQCRSLRWDIAKVEKRDRLTPPGK